VFRFPVHCFIGHGPAWGKTYAPTGTPIARKASAQGSTRFILRGALINASSFTDQTTDTNGQTLYRLAKIYGTPEFVKKASSADVYGDEELKNHQFADPAYRRFPCHTAAATYVSAMFLLEKQASTDYYDIVKNRLDEFAFYHGIKDQVDALFAKEAAPVDSVDGLPDDSFALVLSPDESPSGNSERHYPLRNAVEVRKAAAWLQKFNGELPLKFRTKIAGKVLVKADEYSANLGELEEYLQKQAGMGACASEDAARMLFDRARLLKRANKTDYAL
jgi:hypothetical protein